VLLAEIVVVDSEPDASGAAASASTVWPDGGPVPVATGRPTTMPDSRGTVIT